MCSVDLFFCVLFLLFSRIISQMLSIPGVTADLNQVPLVTGCHHIAAEAFQLLTPGQYLAFEAKLLSPVCYHWGSACINQQRSAGKAFTIFSAGKGNCEIGQSFLGPFQG